MLSRAKINGLCFLCILTCILLFLLLIQCKTLLIAPLPNKSHVGKKFANGSLSTSTEHLKSLLFTSAFQSHLATNCMVTIL